MALLPPGMDGSHGVLLERARLTSCGLDGFLGGLLYRRRLCRFARGSRFGLAGSLVLRQVKLLLDFALPADQFLVTVLLLEVRTNFAFEFFRALVAIRYVCFQLGGAFLESSDGCFERANCAVCSVGDARAVAVPAAHDNFDAVVEARA